MLNASESTDIAAHMNADHADAVLLLARVFGSQPDCQHAVMTGISRDVMQLQISVHAHTELIAIEFDEPINSSQDARRILIQMTRAARNRERKIEKETLPDKHQ